MQVKDLFREIVKTDFSQYNDMTVEWCQRFQYSKHIEIVSSNILDPEKFLNIVSNYDLEDKAPELYAVLSHTCSIWNSVKYSYQNNDLYKLFGSHKRLKKGKRVSNENRPYQTLRNVFDEIEKKNQENEPTELKIDSINITINGQPLKISNEMVLRKIEPSLIEVLNSFDWQTYQTKNLHNKDILSNFLVDFVHPIWENTLKGYIKKIEAYGFITDILLLYDNDFTQVFDYSKKIDLAKYFINHYMDSKKK